MKLLVALIILSLLSACTTRRAPAPISSISNIHSGYSNLNKNLKNKKKYTVSAGETLYSIAFRAGLDYRHLALINNIREPYQIYAGQVLNLTGKVTQGTQNKPQKQPVRKPVLDKNNNKKYIANENRQEYGKANTEKNNKKTESFLTKVRHWRYPSNGKIIEPYSTKENGNKGLDFGGKAGDPIFAAADGKVVYAGNALRGYGNLIIVKHNDDYLSAYAHNRSIKVKEKDWVKAGQVIAEMGQTGTDKVRLHFEIRFRGRSVNPLKYLPKG